MDSNIINLPGSSKAELLAEAFRLTAKANAILNSLGLSNQAELRELIGVIDERFVSGNSVPVERACVKASEWEILEAFLLKALNT